MIEVINSSRLDQLKALLTILADTIDAKPGARDMAQLTKQYRETLREIEEIEGASNDDEVAEILGNRAAEGKPKPVRKDMSKV